jgi:hypothetical protein
MNKYKYAACLYFLILAFSARFAIKSINIPKVDLQPADVVKIDSLRCYPAGRRELIIVDNFNAIRKDTIQLVRIGSSTLNHINCKAFKIK